MMRRIFGNTPFESVTLEDVVLPRHRPRVWDAKKMTSFCAKLHTIPEEFRPYFPCPTEINSDGSMQQAVTRQTGMTGFTGSNGDNGDDGLNGLSGKGKR